MALQQLWLIPLASFLFSVLAFIISYLIAVGLGHVEAILPYISDSGTMAPESCVFGQLLNLAALFFAISLYLRHRQIVEFYWHNLQKEGKWRHISLLLLWIGFFAAFGMSMVANFQETKVLVAHYIGALMTFGLGLVYTWGQTVFSYIMTPRIARPIVSHLRLLLCILATCSFVTCLIFGPILGKRPKEFHDARALFKWTPDTPHYTDHLIGTFSEWVMAACFELYVLSFAIELRHAYCHAPKLRLKALHQDASTEIHTSTSATRITFRSHEL